MEWVGESVRSIVHDFAERLEYSQRLSNEPEWIAFYQRLWPEALSIVRLDADSKWQRAGVDRMIILPNGKEVLIDEKNREKDFSDILLEEWSVFFGDAHPENKLGWTLDPSKHIEYVAYAIHPLQRCYLLPFELLRLAFKHYLPAWKQRKTGKLNWYPKDAKNNGYVTRNCAVPWTILKDALAEQMLRRIGQRLELPIPQSVANQLLFDYPEVTT